MSFQSAYQPSAYPMQNPIITKPQTPYFGTFPALTTGSLVLIYGRIPYGCRRFEFNLMVGSVITEQTKHSADIGFHFNPRFDEQLVVRNSRQNMIWGPEEREPRTMPFVAGKPFEAMILIEGNGYKVAVNGKHFTEFIHRIPVSCVGVFSVIGSVELDRIEFRREQRYLPPPVPAHVALAPVFNPPLPHEHRFSEQLPEGVMIYISGRLNQSPDQFTIDFLSGMGGNEDIDIAFHFNVRVRQSLVVRNTRIAGQWGDEERKIPEFPFYAGVNFDLIIRLEGNRYMVAVNGQHFTEYKHRIPLQFVRGFRISGDLFIASIRFAQP